MCEKSHWYYIMLAEWTGLFCAFIGFSMCIGERMTPGRTMVCNIMELEFVSFLDDKDLFEWIYIYV